jgi:hypothetical protein
MSTGHQTLALLVDSTQVNIQKAGASDADNKYKTVPHLARAYKEGRGAKATNGARPPYACVRQRHGMLQ